jgi:hypothetical protein
MPITDNRDGVGFYRIVILQCLTQKVNDMKRAECQDLDRVLEAAVVVTWPDLIAVGDSGIVHLEYDFGARGNITFLQVWLSQTRGVWHLVYSYFGSTFDQRGIQFENGYRSPRLAETLNSVMHHQDAFLPPPNLGRPGLLQITTPSEKERVAAAISIREAFDQVASTELALV